MLVWGVLVTPFCAICGDSIASDKDIRREPLGRDDAMVVVCSDCSSVQYRARPGPERGYPVPDDGGKSYRKTLARTVPAGKALPPMLHQSHRERTPGMVIVRVPHRAPNGRSRDFRDADASLRDKPWYAARRYLGTDGKNYIYERPVTQRHSIDAVDTLASLEAYRTDIDDDGADDL